MEDKGNLQPRGRARRWESGSLEILCRTCGHRFSDRRSSPLYPMKLPPAKAVRILSRLSKRQGMRSVAEAEGVSPVTVNRLAKRAEARADEMRKWLVDTQHVREGRANEIIRFLMKRPELQRKNRFR